MALYSDDTKAFDTIFRKYYQPLTAYAYQLVGIDDAQEIVQDVMLWLWEKRENLEIRKSLSAYLYQAVRLRCLSAIEHDSSKRRRETLYWQNSSSEYIDDEGDYDAEELQGLIREAIDRLPENLREVFIKICFEDKDYKQVAAELGISASSVYYRMSQAMKHLKKDLKDYFPLVFLFF